MMFFLSLILSLSIPSRNLATESALTANSVSTANNANSALNAGEDVEQFLETWTTKVTKLKKLVDEKKESLSCQLDNEVDQLEARIASLESSNAKRVCELGRIGCY